MRQGKKRGEGMGRKTEIGELEERVAVGPRGVGSEGNCSFNLDCRLGINLTPD